MRLAILSALLILPVGCGYDVPLDTGAEPLLNVISGTVVVTGLSQAADTFLLLFPADDPPPPSGTGSPVDFTTVRSWAFDTDSMGIVSAPYAFTDVPDGTYIVTALVDVDADFHPLWDFRAGATCGDVLGAHLADIKTQAVGAVTVGGGELVDGVAVVAASEMTFERPAYKFVSNGVSQTAKETQSFTLASIGVFTEDFVLTGPADTSNLKLYDPCDTHFLTVGVDADLDGVVDPHPRLGDYGLYDIWPRIYLSYLGPVEDAGGTVLAEGESYVSEAAVYPVDYLPVPYGTGTVPANTYWPASQLTAVYLPFAQHVMPDGSSEIVQAPDVPRGRWAVTVISPTGQTWTVPNMLAQFESTDEEAFKPLTQGGYLLVE